MPGRHHSLPKGVKTTDGTEESMQDGKQLNILLKFFLLQQVLTAHCFLAKCLRLLTPVKNWYVCDNFKM